jgi:mannose-6-phosphate isomerase
VNDSDLLYPITFTPAFQQYVWGGRNLELLYGRRLPEGNVAESWEVSAHPAGMSTANNGPLAGLSLPQIQDRLGLDLLGSNAAGAMKRRQFPLLVKLLDAQQRLSVQVHPDDAFAQAHEAGALGKSEMWVVLHAEPDAAIILGVKEGSTPSAFRQAIAGNTLDQYLHRLPLQRGDFVCVPSGSLHAILGGLVIAEIQQSSNVTYRVYDWGRNAAGRPLHIDKALQVIDFEQVEPNLPTGEPLPADEGYRHELLCRNSYFTVERLTFAAGARFRGRCNGRTLELWGTTTGRAAIWAAGYSTELPTVRFALLPAAMGDFEIRAREITTLLRVYIEGENR